MNTQFDARHALAESNVAATRHNIKLALGRGAAETLLEQIRQGDHQPGDLAKAIDGLRGTALQAFLRRIEAALEDAL
jgi:hypothetical protein